MKEFNRKKFQDDLISLRGNESQTDFAPRLSVNRSTLSLLENGKQIPTIDILNRVCNISGNRVDDYFIESNSDSLVYLMGCLNESDKDRIKEMAEHIRIKEKYELLAKRSSYALN